VESPGVPLAVTDSSNDAVTSSNTGGLNQDDEGTWLYRFRDKKIALVHMF
jgi:hypothetical protein